MICTVAVFLLGKLVVAISVELPKENCYELSKGYRLAGYSTRVEYHRRTK